MAKIDWFAIDTAARVSLPLTFAADEFLGNGVVMPSYIRVLRSMSPIVDCASANSAYRVVSAFHGAAADCHANIHRLDGVHSYPCASRVVTMLAYLDAFEPNSEAATEIAAETAAEAIFAATDQNWDVRQNVWNRINHLSPNALAYFVRMLDIDVHSTAELETALVATDYALEHGRGYDAQAQMETLRRLGPVLKSIKGTSWRSTCVSILYLDEFGGVANNKFRKPAWDGLPGAHHPGWSTFLSWPAMERQKWLDVLIAAVQPSHGFWGPLDREFSEAP